MNQPTPSWLARVTAGDLAATMSLNVDLKVFSANGYYDFVTPFYQTMLDLYNGCCWICGKKATQTLNVDHDHTTGQVRGLLDFLCNKKRIGRHRREHAYLFKRAYEYLLNEFDWRDDVDSREIPKREVDPKGQKRRSRRRRRVR